MRWMVMMIYPMWILSAGCAGLNQASSRPSPLVEMNKATAKVSSSLDAYLVLVKPEKSSQEEPQMRTMGGVNISSAPSPTSLVGIVVSERGHVIVPTQIEPSVDLRIRAFIGDKEYRARICGKDESLNMTLLQLTGTGPFVPLPALTGAEPSPGEWLVTRIPTDEDGGFEKHTMVLNVRGELPGHIRRFGAMGLYRETRGAPILNLQGSLVGIANQSDILLWSDIRGDVADLVERTLSGQQEDPNEKSKAWLGVVVNPVNKDWARSRNWPLSCLRVTHVEAGAPADKAGLKVGDLVTGLNEKPLRFTGDRTKDFFTQALRARVGRPFTLAVRRGEETLNIAGVMEKKPEAESLVVEELGVTVQSIIGMDVLTRSLSTSEGVLVTDLVKGGAAANSGNFGQTLLMKDDVIISLAGKPTPTLEAFREAAAAIRRDRPEAVVVEYRRGRFNGFAGLNLKSAQKATGDKS